MKDFSFARSINFAVSQEVVRPREVFVADEDRPKFGYLKTSELKKGKAYPIQLLYPDPVKNPDGVIIKKMYQFPDVIDTEGKGGYHQHKCRVLMVPSCYKENAPDYMLGVFKNLSDLINGPSNQEYVQNDPKDPKKGGCLVMKEGETELTRTDEFNKILSDDLEFRLFIKTLTEPWVQVIIPALIYATADVKTVGKYDRFYNFEPDLDMENYIPVLFQIKYSKAVQEGLLDNLVPRGSEGKLKTYYPWNDAMKGSPFLYTPLAQGHKFEKMDSQPLDEDFSALLGANPDYYVDLVDRELKKSYKPDELKGMLLACPEHLLKPLRDFGVLDTE